MRTKVDRNQARLGRGLAVTSAIGVALFATSCKDEPAAGGEPGAPASVNQSDGLNLVGGGGKSAHFDAVASHLHVGGTVFGYMDVDGDVEKIADLIQDLLSKAPAGELPPHIEILDLKKVLADIGLDGVEAMGISSYKNGELYHNRGYLHVPAGRKGILKMLGGDAGPFVAASLAPEDADLVIEQTLNIAAAYEVVGKVITHFGGAEAYSEFRQELGQPTPVGLSMADIFGKLDTRLTMFARVHPDKPLEIPDAPMEIPSFDFLVALDNVSWLYDKVTGTMKEEMPPEQVQQMFVKGDGFEKIALPPMPDPEMVLMQPVIYHDVASKRVLVASSQAFLDECLSGKTKLGDGEGFKAATEGLPSEGNGLSYVSANLMKTARGMFDAAMKAGGEQGGMGAAEVAIMSVFSGVLAGHEHGQASVLVNEPNGIFSSSNATSSVKEGALMSGLSFMATGLMSFQNARYDAPMIHESFETEDAEGSIRLSPPDETRSIPPQPAEPQPIPSPVELAPEPAPIPVPVPEPATPTEE